MNRNHIWSKKSSTMHCKYTWILFFYILNFAFDLGGGHEIESLVVPVLADPRENATLSCRYNMGSEQLYSAKWFKDDKEVFRYMPAQDPPELEFNVRGVNMFHQPICSQSSCDLILTSLSSQSQGKYRCEVSTEAPTFRIVHKTSYMTIAALPRKDPKLEGLAAHYSLGDEIRVNCTSDVSLPPPQLTLFVNEKEVFPEQLEGPWEINTDALGLSSKSLGLRLQVTKHLFNNSPLRIRCAALLPSYVPGGPHRRQTQQTTQLAPPSNLKNLALSENGASLNKLNVKLLFTLIFIVARHYRLSIGTCNVVL